MLKCPIHRVYRGKTEPRHRDCIDCWRVRRKYLNDKLTESIININRLTTADSTPYDESGRS